VVSTVEFTSLKWSKVDKARLRAEERQRKRKRERQDVPSGRPLPQQQQHQQQSAASAAETAPTDHKAYYDQFWQYTAYYGEEAARKYYGFLSPP